MVNAIQGGDANIEIGSGRVTLAESHKYIVRPVNKGTRSSVQTIRTFSCRIYTGCIVETFGGHGRGRGRAATGDLKPGNLSFREEADRSDERDEAAVGG